MARGGYRPNSGRKKIEKKVEIQKGIKKPEKLELPDDMKPNAEAAAMIDSTITPLSYLLSIVQDGCAEKADRVRAAALALPFCHAKVGEKGEKEKRGDNAERAASGKFAVPKAPLRMVK